MSTRGVVGYYKNGNLKVTFNHFDSYPGGLGESVKQYIFENINNLDDHFNNIKLINNEQLTDSIEEELNSLEQGNLLEYVTLGYMFDEKEFLKDSLFCGWAYIIDLDKKVLEIYRGFNENKPKGKFKNWGKAKITDKYFPVTLVKTIPFEKIKNFDMCKFEEKIYKKENKE